MKGSLLGQPPWGKLSASGSALALAPPLRLHLVQAGKGAHVPWRDSKLTRHPTTENYPFSCNVAVSRD